MAHFLEKLARPSVKAGMTAVLLTACSGTDTTSPARTSLRQPQAGSSRYDFASMTVVTIDFPGSTGTFGMDLNADDDVVGRYAVGSVTHGFLRAADGQFTSVDVPGASFTVASAINSGGDIAGMYALPTAPTERHGFLLRDGVWTTIDPDGSKFTNILGISAQGDVVGRYCTKIPCGRAGSGTYHGFLSKDGVVTSFDVPNSVETNAWKITSEGDIFGGFRYADNVNRFFVLRDGEFTTFDLPGGVVVAQDDGGMNERGDIVGVYCNAAPCDFASATNHGFLLPKRGELVTFDIPGARTTNPLGINAHGDVAGAYNDAVRNHAFLLKR
jgi:uncharacterized membrane protein